MKLTSILFRRNRLPNGHIFRGKDRLVKRVEPFHLRKLEHSFAIEEQNMFLLRHPYLSEAESFGHSKAVGKPENRINMFKDNHRKMFKDDVTLYERFKHLHVTENWD